VGYVIVVHEEKNLTQRAQREESTEFTEKKEKNLTRRTQREEGAEFREKKERNI
jgi:hypothetical protein